MFYLILYFATTILLPLYFLLLLIRFSLGKENMDSIKNRFALSDLDRPEGQLIWVHAASVGESVAAKTLIEALKKKYKDANFLITTGTITSAKIIKKWQIQHCVHQFAPADNIIFVSMFLSKWQPDLAIFIESDLWPTLTKKASECCELLLVNARMSDKSFARWSKYSAIFREIINNCTKIYVQSDIDAKKFQELGARQIINLGNLKFSNKELPVDKENLQELKKVIGKKHVFVAASTHSEDEEVVVPAIKKLHNNGVDFFSVIILRHPERLGEITELCNYYQLKYSIRSKSKTPQKEDDVYIIDTFGELGTFFSLADIAFIGGSFKRGGHNLMEPAYFNCAILLGPDMTNYQNITAEMINSEAVIQIKDQNELEEKIEFFLSEEGIKLGTKLGKNALKYIKSREEIIDNYINEIAKYIK